MNNCNFVIGSKRIRSNVEQIIDNISIESTLKCDITFQDNDCNYSTIRGPEVACFHSDNVDWNMVATCFSEIYRCPPVETWDESCIISGIMNRFGIPSHLKAEVRNMLIDICNNDIKHVLIVSRWSTVATDCCKWPCISVRFNQSRPLALDELHLKLFAPVRHLKFRSLASGGSSWVHIWVFHCVLWMVYAIESQVLQCRLQCYQWVAA